MNWYGSVCVYRQFAFKTHQHSRGAKSYSREHHIRMTQGHNVFTITCWLDVDMSFGSCLTETKISYMENLLSPIFSHCSIWKHLNHFWIRWLCGYQHKQASFVYNRTLWPPDTLQGTIGSLCSKKTLYFAWKNWWQAVWTHVRQSVSLTV